MTSFFRIEVIEDKNEKGNSQDDNDQDEREPKNDKTIAVDGSSDEENVSISICLNYCMVVTCP